jgi:two-component system response regulator NreC
MMTTEESPARILIVEDHEMVRQGIAALLSAEKDLQVVGGTGDGYEAVRLAEALRPDVVVMDLTLKGRLSGIEATALLRERIPEVRVVILSMHDDAPTVDRALKAGARGYVIKGRGISSLTEAIRAVRRGDMYLSPDTSEYVVQGYATASAEPKARLTEREAEILTLIAEGHTGRQIAERLGLRPKTVDNHRSRIMEKLNIHSTAGLVRYALREGLVPPTRGPGEG